MSALTQSLRPLEVIIIDDGSADNTWQIISRLAKSFQQIRKIRHRTAIGIVDSLNEGVQRARGELIARLDHDDVCWPERLRLQVPEFAADSKVVIVSGFVEPLFDSAFTAAQIRSGKAFEERRRRIVNRGDSLAEALREGNLFYHPEVVFRRDVFNAVGGYRNGFSAAEDYDLFLRMSELGTIAIVPHVILTKSCLSSGISSRMGERQRLAAELARLCTRLRSIGMNDSDFIPASAEELEPKIEAARVALFNLGFEI